MANIQIIHQDAMTLFEETFTDSFDEMIDEIIYPIFIQRFSFRRDMLQLSASNQYDTVKNIKSEQDCLSYGPHCPVALRRLNDMLNQFYHKFSVLNQEYGLPISASQFDWDRYYGTLLANMNFQIDMDYEKFWSTLKHTEPSDTLMKRSMNNPNVASSQLQNDLVKLVDTIIPSQNTSLTDVLGLLGYSDPFVVTGIKSTYEVSNKNVLHPRHGLDPMHIERSTCDLRLYFERWNEYLLLVGKIIMSDSKQVKIS